MPHQISIGLDLISQLTKVFDLNTANSKLNYQQDFNWTDGSGASQSEAVFHDKRTLSASATEDLDLAGSLVDAFGDTITFTAIKALIVKADATNTNDVHVGGAASNALVNWVGDATDIVVVKPGGLLALIAEDATGYTITAGTADILKIANSAAGTDVTYEIILVGETS